MRYKETPFGREVIENNLSKQNYQDFKYASKTLNTTPNLFNSKTQEMGNLGDLTPQDAVEVDKESKAREVNDVANKFLHYLGTPTKNLNNYNLNVGENNSLSVTTKDGRGVILERENGRTKINNLEDKDRIFFQKLDKKVTKEVRQVKEQKRKARESQKNRDRQREKTR